MSKRVLMLGAEFELSQSYTGHVSFASHHKQPYQELSSDGPLMAAERETNREKPGGGQWRER